MNTNKIFNLLLALVFAFSILEMPSSVLAQEPLSNPVVAVYPVDRQVFGWNWTPQATIQVSAGSCSTTTVSDPTGNFYIQFGDSCRLQVGDTVTTSDGITTKSYVIASLLVTGADAESDTVYGTAEPGSNIQVWICDSNGCINRHEIPNESRNWSANFSVPGDEPDEQNTFDLQPGNQGDVVLHEADGNATSIRWRIPNPIIWGVIASSNWINGREWPRNSSVQIRIDDPSTPEDPDSMSSQNTDANGSFNHQSQYDISTGSVVSVTYGNTTKQVTVSNFEVTAFDAHTRTLSGIGTPNTNGAVWITTAPIGWASFVIDSSGSWQVEFTEAANIASWSRGFAIEQDADGDGTQSNWPPHYIEASINRPGHSIEGYDWYLGSSISLTVDNPGNGVGIDYADIQTAGLDDWGGTRVDFDLESFRLETGAIVTLTDGVITQTHTVAYLDITDVDAETDRVFGKASPASTVQVASPNHSRRNVVADQAGNWIADFSMPGSGEDEQRLDDIQEGKGFTTRQYGEGGNRTRLYWRVPDYKVIAYPDEDVIAATDFWPGTPVTITVDDPSNGVGVDLTRSGVVDTETGGWNCQTWWGYCFVLDLREEFDIQPGQLITITDGTHTVSHIVTTLSITNVDFAASTVAGTAEPLSDIYLELWPSCGQRQLSADEYGSWLEDFSIPGDEDFEQETCDFSIDELRDIVAYQGSGEGETWVGRYMPYPGFEVVLGSNNINGWDWPLGATLTLEVDDPSTPVNPDYAGSAVVGPASWDPNKPFFEAVTTGYDIKPGDIVTVTDGARIKSTIVADIVINSIDVGTDTISGTAPPEAEVHVISDDGPERFTNADTLGNWSVDFSVEQDGNPVLNLVFGSAGVLSAIDDDGDRTYIGWNAPDDSDGDGVPDSEDNAPNDYNPDQGNVDGDGTADVLDPCPDDATDSCNTNGSAAGVMGEQGGTITTPNGKASLNIPAGSVHEEVSFTITDMGSGYELTSDQGSMMVVHSYSIQPNGTQFDPPATIIFRWDDADHDGIVDGTTVQEADLLLVKDGIVIASSCETNPSCNMNADELTVEVSSLSLFALAVPIEWTLKGFYQPVDMNGVYNTVKGGSTVPLKFEIFTGSTELTDIAYIRSLTYAQTSCDANATTDEIETTATGGTSLRYADGHFIYNWKTPKSAGKCYRVTMTTIDGSTLMAYFRLK